MQALIVGLGSIGRIHAANLRTLRPNSRLVFWRSSRDSGAAADFPGARTVHDLESALDSRPDCAIIATLTHLHADAVIALLESGIRCYIEKPLVADRRQLDRVRAAVAALDRVPATLIGCNLRFLESLHTLRALAGTAIGRIVRANLVAGQWLPAWRPA